MADKHVFQPIPLELYEANPFEKIGKEWFAITVKDGEKVNAMTASWGGLGVMWGKNVAFVVVRESRYTHEFLEKADRFSMTFFDMPHYKSTLNYLGKMSGRIEDKIANARLHVDYDGDTPYIDEGKEIFICRKLCNMPMDAEHYLNAEDLKKWYADKDYHTLYIAEIEKIMCR